MQLLSVLKKAKIIYVPSEWMTLVRCAKVNEMPYIGYEMSFEDF